MPSAPSARAFTNRLWFSVRRAGLMNKAKLSLQPDERTDPVNPPIATQDAAEPVAWLHKESGLTTADPTTKDRYAGTYEPLYRHPPAGAAAQAGATDKLHAAICQAVAILNVAPELAAISEGRQISAILRGVLATHADFVMDQPTTEAEQVAMRKLHRSRK